MSGHRCGSEDDSVSAGPTLVDGSRHTVAIIGGGVAGCATALALAAHGVDDVVVIDAGRRSRWRIGEAIPPAARALLTELDLWENFLAQRPLPSAGSCASWGKPDLSYNDVLLDGQGKAWHLDRAAFDAMLMDAVSERGGNVVRGQHLRDVERGVGAEHVLCLEGTDGGRTRIAAGFLVDATGVQAGAVRRLGVARNQIDCLAVVFGVFDLAEPDAVPTQTLLEACDYGWWYAARLPNSRLIAALAVEPSEQRHFGEIGTWMAALCETRHVASWLARGRAAPLDRAPDLALAPVAILSRVVGAHWLAVGDAASACDPLLSQGIIKALGDGKAAAQAIASCLAGAGEAPLLAYQQDVFARFRQNLRLCQQFYRLERRWWQAPFWRARRLPE
jgi:flavin-dependent dehydrogenase